MSSSASDNDANDCFSMMGTSEVSKPNSTNSNKKRKSMSGSVYKAWSFQLTIKADFGSCTAGTAGEKGELLTEHLKTRTGHGLPSSVTSMAVFFDELLCSVPPDDAGLVSIALQGYVQARYAIPLSTLKKWIHSASWKPVPGGLTSNIEFLTNMRKFEDPSDTWTQLMVFGKVGANNFGRSVERKAQQVGFYNHLIKSSSL